MIIEKYKLMGFQKSNKKNKKYDAILENTTTGKIKYVSFGSSNPKHATYRDKTGLNLYDIHGDKKRRKSYIARHTANDYHKKKYSPAWFSLNYLW